MLTSKQMGVKIGGIRKSSEAIRKNVHEVLCNAAGYAFEHGDATYFTRLINATNGINQQRIKRWIKDNGLVTWNKEKSQYTLNKKQKNERVTEFDDVQAFCLHLFTEVPQWHIDPPKAEVEEKPFDVKVWAATQFKKHPDQIEAMIRALSEYREGSNTVELREVA